ncbi:MAG TPA: TonB-dependent receptor [Steroidobacter sp.]|uniref:TonB-dependent receptor n=1 Tax=Steroidobacter sp. TaxID=1978227 RepID=UPI002ED7E5F8
MKKGEYAVACVRLASLIAAMGSSLGMGLAQAAEGTRASGLEEVIVTAERREASLQEVPLAITAFSANDLDRSGLQSTVDLQYRTPGLVFTTNAALGQPYIRGIGTDIVNVGTDPSVAVHVDGIYQTRATASIQELFDVERVEIVKGPQGTLYGRNATGGAINAINREPQHEFEAAMDVLYGNYDKRRIRGMVNAPLVQDRVALRVAGFATQRDGYSRDVFKGQEIDDEDMWAARAKLALELADDVHLGLGVDHMKEDSRRNLASKLNPNLPSPARDVFGAVISQDPRIVAYNDEHYLRLEHTLVSAKLEWKLGDVKLTSLTGYTEAKNRVKLDIDSTEVAFTRDIEDEDVRALSQELQLTGENGALQWLLGAFYLHEKAEQHLRIFFTPFDADTDYPVENKVDAYALFAQGTYAFSDAVRLTAGLRYSTEEKKAVFRNVVTDPFGVLTGEPGGGVFESELRPRDDWSAWTPKIGIDWDVADDVMLYAAATKGFKSGGFNLTGAGEQFDPEYIWSYEVGVKSTLLDRRLRLNAAAFYYDYSDLQVNRFNEATGGATTSVTNAASARVNGLELEVNALLAEGLDLDLGVALLDAEYRNFRSANPDGENPFVEEDLSGNTLPRSPKAVVSAGLQYSQPLGSTVLTLRGEGRRQSQVWFDQFNSPGVEQDAYTLWNAFVTLRDADDRWRVQLYGRNLSDELYRQSVIRATSILGTIEFWGAPRTYGIELGWNW